MLFGFLGLSTVEEVVIDLGKAAGRDIHGFHPGLSTVYEVEID